MASLINMAIIGMSVFLKEDRMTEKLGHAATCTCVEESISQMVKEWLVMEDLKVMVLKFVLSTIVMAMQLKNTTTSLSGKSED